MTIAFLLISLSFFVFCVWFVFKYSNGISHEIKEAFEEIIADCKPGLINYVYIIIFLVIRVIYTVDIIFL
jgi:hypothetical protein